MGTQALNVRVPDEQMAQIEGQAKALGMTKTEVVRLALAAHFSLNKNTDRVASLLDSKLAPLAQAVTDQKATFEELVEYQQKTTLLLLKVLAAPPEAEQALKKLFAG